MPVDPRIAPPMFLRSDRLGAAVHESEESDVTPAKPFEFERTAMTEPRSEGSVRDAFLGYAKSRLAEAARIPAGTRYETPATVAHQHLRERGFSDDEIRELRFGLYTNPRDVHTYLQRLGFSEEAIRLGGLVQDVDGRPRHDWTGNVVVPVTDHTGRVVDVFAFDPRNPADARFLHGPDATDIAAYGLDEAKSGDLAERLVLVENVVDAMYLRRRGLVRVAATGCPPARFTPQRWRNLVHAAGVRSVTLAFNRDSGRESRIHDVLAHALTARVAPTVYVVDAHEYLEVSTAAAFVQRYGADAIRRAMRSAAHAFEGKDYEGTRPTEPQPPFEPKARPRNGYAKLSTGLPAFSRHRTYLESEVDKIAHPGQRAAWRSFVADIDAAIRLGQFDRARAIADDWYARMHPAPVAPSETTTLEEAIDAVRHSSIRDEFDGRELDPRFDVETFESVETIEIASRASRLAKIASRLARAIADDPEGTHVVVRTDFTEREMTLALVSRMTNEMTDGPGLGYDAVWSRMRGVDPREGYEDRPWLVDEAVDRLLASASNVRFVDGRRMTGEITTAIDAMSGPIATILCDAGVRNVDEFDERFTPRTLAGRFECPVTVVREPAECMEPEPAPTATPETRRAYVATNGYRYEPEWSNWHVADEVTEFRLSDRSGFHGVLREWIADAETFDGNR